MIIIQLPIISQRTQNESKQEKKFHNAESTQRENHSLGLTPTCFHHTFPTNVPQDHSEAANEHSYL